MTRIYIPPAWTDGRYSYSLEPVPGWIDMESIPVEELAERYSQLIAFPALPPITEPPRAGDVIRDNASICELTVERVIETQDGMHIVCRSPGGNRHYYSAVRLERGRLLVGPRCAPGATGGGMYPGGQQELFVLERAPREAASLIPFGRAAREAQMELFA